MKQIKVRHMKLVDGNSGSLVIDNLVEIEISEKRFTITEAEAGALCSKLDDLFKIPYHKRESR